MEYANQIAFVTGAGAGIGRATAVAFARKGAKVAVSDINETSGQETVNQIKQDGGNAFFVRCDVANPGCSIRSGKCWRRKAPVSSQFGEK